jgi:hypothetical protein
MSLSVLAGFELLLLIWAANGAPVLAARLLGPRWAQPLDGGARWRDGRPLFGPSKTVRGVFAAVAAVLPLALLLGWSWSFGVLFAGASMAGDLCSSFIKRRLGIQSSGRAPGLDQIPEALFPLLACWRWLDLTGWDVVAVVAAFTLAQQVLSPLLFRLGIRRQPH